MTDEQIKMTDSIIKNLKWLIFNFPQIENPKDDADKTFNCIHLYCQNAVDELNRQKAEIERLKEANQKLYEEMAERQKEEVAIARRMGKSEAVKEFWNRLKKEADFISGGDHGFSFEIREDVAVDIIKEMVGDGDA